MLSTFACALVVANMIEIAPNAVDIVESRILAK